MVKGSSDIQSLVAASNCPPNAWLAHGPSSSAGIRGGNGEETRRDEVACPRPRSKSQKLGFKSPFFIQGD